MRYQVLVSEVHYVIVDVEADNEEAAKDAASNVIAEGSYASGDPLPEPVYGYTIEPDAWQCREHFI